MPYNKIQNLKILYGPDIGEYKARNYCIEIYLVEGCLVKSMNKYKNFEQIRGF